jgi:hypothetical protein
MRMNMKYVLVALLEQIGKVSDSILLVITLKIAGVAVTLILESDVKTCSLFLKKILNYMKDEYVDKKLYNLILVNSKGQGEIKKHTATQKFITYNERRQKLIKSDTDRRKTQEVREEIL